MKARLLQPGLPSLPPGTERYRIRGGGATVISLAPDDRLEIIDPEGLQSCEVAVFDRNGRPACRLLGAAPSRSRPAVGIPALLAGRSEDAVRVAQGLGRRRITLTGMDALHLFDGETAAGERIELTAEDEAVCVVAAPGGPMRVDRQDPPTDLILYVHRRRVPENAPAVLPEPLADSLEELTIEPGTARAYRVRAGEFIQIIDVRGRECSDFQCFTTAGLDRGIERSLHATTTRTLMAAAYPGPGLYSKFYDIDMQPLLEVVRDTVGRHDMFGLACTAKYYADLGYPGHVNCSDNFSRALAPYGVAPRRGWEAINFFYNTGLDAQNQLFLDEPWSRPGDYVLLQAQRDLVCVSSACPDDIDAANAWNPTEIHVRIYPELHRFTRAIAYRMTTDSEPELTKETGFHPRTSMLTRNYAAYRGYWLPNAYAKHGAIEEYWACREAVIVTDLSPLRKFEVMGPDAEALLQWTLTRNVRRLAVGQVVYTAMCYPSGGMLDDGTVFRLGRDNFRFIGGDEYCGVWLRQQAQERGLRAWVKSSTEQLHNISVQGPRSRDLLREVVWTPPAQPSLVELDWFRFAIGRIGHFDGTPLLVSRTGYTGELGYEIWCHPEHAVAVWDAIWEAGRGHGLTPLGLAALDMLRIEAGLIFAGHEFDDQTDPFEAGIGFAVALEGNEDFAGKTALVSRRQHPQRTLVGLELAGEEPGAHGDCVHVGRSQVGVITSGVRSPCLQKNVALCRMAIEYSGLGTEVEVGKIDGHQKRIPATVVRFPFYDPEKTRVRG